MANWVDEWMDGQLGRLMVSYLDRWMDGWMEGQLERWIN